MRSVVWANSYALQSRCEVQAESAEYWTLSSAPENNLGLIQMKYPRTAK